MAVKITRGREDYLTDDAFLYDMAKTSTNFDKSVYEGVAATGNTALLKDYLVGIAGYKDKELPSSFNQEDYDYLDASDKAAYWLLTAYGEKNSKTYQDTMSVFNQKIHEKKKEETFNDLSGFDKFMNSVAGVGLNTVNTVYGMIEGLWDAAQLLVGGVAAGVTEIIPGGYDAESAWDVIKKERVLKDDTKTGAFQSWINEYTDKNTYIGKNQVWNGVNEVLGNVARIGVSMIPAVGQLTYWGSMAGNVATEAMQTDPDINFAELLAYTGVSVGAEAVVEKLSAKILGGAGTFVDKKLLSGKVKGLTKLGQFVNKNWVTRIIGQGLAEGMEEFVQEFVNTTIWNVTLGMGGNGFKEYSVKDALYAGLIGGIAGGLLGGVQIATQSKLVKTAEGQIVTKKSAEKAHLDIAETYNKVQSMDIAQAISELKVRGEQSRVADILVKKYDGKLTEQQFAEQHPEEYKKALEYDQKKLTPKINDAIATLAKFKAILGDDGFNKAVELADKTYSNESRLANNYLSRIEGRTQEQQNVQKSFETLNPGLSLTVRTDLNPMEQRLQNNMLKRYGIAVVFGKVGKLPGYMADKPSYAIGQDTIVVDSDLVNEMNMTPEALVKEVIKHELVHGLQYNLAGKITPKTLLTLQEAVKEANPDAVIVPQELSSEYKDADALAKLTEAQAQAVAEVLLFDDLTVSKIFYTEYSTLNKVYQFLQNLKKESDDKKEYMKAKGKIKYNTILKIMQHHRFIAAKKLGTIKNVDEYIKEFSITQEEADKLRATYLPNESVPPIDEWETELGVAGYRRKSNKTRQLDGQMTLDDAGTAQPNTGVHYGDFSKGIVKVETASQWDSKRNTGAFGTGTYLFSNEASETTAASGYNNKANKSKYIIDTSKYNLFKPADSEQAQTLYDALEAVNNYVLENDKYHEGVEKESYRDIDEVVTDLANVLGVDSNKVYNVLLTIAQKDYKTYENEKGKVTDTPATLLMKSFGYDGVDNRGIKYFDTAEHGTVIYDLKPEDAKLVKGPEITEQTKLDLSEVPEQEVVKQPKKPPQKKEDKGKQVSLFNTAIKIDAKTGEFVFDFGENEDTMDNRRKVETELNTKAKLQHYEFYSKNASNSGKYESKYDQLVKKLPDPIESTQQGEMHGTAKYIPVEGKFRDANDAFFAELTSDELQGLIHWAEQPRDGELEMMQARAARAHLLQYAYDHMDVQFPEIKEWILVRHQLEISYGLQQGGIANATYGAASLKTLQNEIWLKWGGFPELTKEQFSTFLPKGVSIKQYSEDLLNQLKELDAKIKGKGVDAWSKYVLRREYNSLNKIKIALDSGDWVATIDAMVNDLQQRQYNQAEHAEQVGDIYKNVIEFFLVNTNVQNGKVVNFEADNRKLNNEAMEKVVNVLSSINTFRYIALLSSPATWFRNKLANITMSTNAILEDALGGWFEKTTIFGGKPILDNPNQMRFQGSYNKKFSEFVDNTFKAALVDFTGGNKYSDSEHQLLIQKYQAAKNEKDRAKWLTKLTDFENKMMSDQPQVVSRALSNIKHTLAGSIGIIRSQMTMKLATMFGIKQSDVKTTVQEELINALSGKKEGVSGNEELLKKYQDAMSDSETSMVSACEIAIDLDLPVMSKSLDVKEGILYVSLFRANKLLLKTDNWLTKEVQRLRKSGHTFAAATVEAIFPFIRSTVNTTAYILDRSPIGIGKAIFKLLQTKKSYVIDMKQSIIQHYKDRYTDEVLKASDTTTGDPTKTKRKPFKQNEFVEWLSTAIDAESFTAIQKGNNKKIIEIYNELVNYGFIPYDTAGSTNPYMRAMALEQLSQGVLGTTYMILGTILGAVLGAFAYDEDDNMGAVIKVGNWKISLNDLSPFATLFAASAVLTSDKTENKFTAFADVITDATIFSTFDSAISYNNSFLDWVGGTTINWTQQFIPSVVKSFAKLADNNIKSKRTSFWGKLLDTTLTNLPFFSYIVPNKVNPYTGYPMKRYEYGFFGALANTFSPVEIVAKRKSQMQKEAERLGAITNGISGRYTVGEKKYTLSTSDRAKYGKYNAQYVKDRYAEISGNREKVSLVDSKTGKRVAKYWSQMTDDEKKRTLKQIYSSASSLTKIKWWTDKGYRYYTSNKSIYYDYRDLFGNNIIYDPKWGSKDNFVEGK